MLSPRQRSDALPVVEAALALISLPGRSLSWRSLVVEDWTYEVNSGDAHCDVFELLRVPGPPDLINVSQCPPRCAPPVVKEWLRSRRQAQGQEEGVPGGRNATRRLCSVRS
ncbi:hypothetical protein PHYSODRAFT_289154 [Phytophthora sojae]|uniref:Uncharacterized protein n=1 Tax=Phytophthora sojae (strain P6497) TaxID=1094619 RepID=G5AEM0_PHYSP|nr:hypothetical protein PHYSODRAFT_284360 [Phytophthora sojae]XP_009538521.1 hypothetical protein PHYSODRAFT_289154 [Phytophthora sojae]EGZ05660.1 hypothetical protein PHYSODRAFT_289154 [Phytophthora sojae]EGZ28900.1 hypothetical protein PHYSODRAFT_284360 [Phytophthora sojae]|eukprot:XP_009516175.1 hypothetical protein PHYSODRAFT_284360 [Phytophthora sojae]